MIPSVFALVLLFGFTNTALAGQDDVLDTVKSVEERLGGRVGVAIYDDESGNRWEYRANERFPMSSTFKAFACGAVLAQVDAGEEDLTRIVSFGDNDLVSYSPVTKKRAGPAGMTVREICEAATAMSDNTAGNLILKSLGGPSGFTAYMRSIGDSVTQLDRWETALNESIPGDKRDTTTPVAAAASLRALIFENILSSTSKKQLTNWMLNDKVADQLIRAALPKGWRIADKSGAGGYGSRSIIAVIWPPERKPIIVAIFMTENTAQFALRNAAIAEIGAAIVKAISE